MKDCCSSFAPSPSNIFANTSFDVLKIDGVADPLISVNKLATMDIEESYFLTTVEFIKESNRQYTNAKSILYHAIAESAGDDIAINEGFTEFFGAVHDIIAKFLKFIKSLFDKFINALMSLVGSEKYLSKNKKKLDDFRAGDEFEITGYNYTFNGNVPVDSAVLNTTNVLTAGLAEDPTSMASLLSSYKNTPHEDICDKFRAQILGKDGETIDESDFSEELFRIFRNDELNSETIEIDTAEFKKVKNRFFDYSKTKKDVEKHLKDINKVYKELEDDVRKFTKDKEKFIDSKALVDKISGTYTDVTNNLGNEGSDYRNFYVSVDLFMKDRADLVQKISNIHALAFSAKLDALKDCCRQDKAVLYKGLSKILRTNNARGLS